MKNPLNTYRDTIQSFSPRKRKLLGVAAAAGIVVLCFLAFYIPLHRRSLEYAVEQINGAIAEGRKEGLSPYVDVALLSRHFADTLLAYEGKQQATGERARIEGAIRVALQELFQNGEEAGEKPKEKTGSADTKDGKGKEENKTSSPLGSGILPPDTLAQLRRKPFQIQTESGKMAVLAAPLENKELKWNTVIKLIARAGTFHWQVTEIGNTEELIQEYIMAIKKKKTRAIAAYYAENAARRELMNRHYAVSKCEAFLARLGEQADIPLVVTVEGANLGKESLVSAGMACQLQKKDGTVLATLPLNAARRIEPGNLFQQSWQVELSRSFPETGVLLREPALQCSIVLSAVSLGNGRIVYLRQAKELDELRK